MINSRHVDLLDDDRLLGQLVGLERSTARSGRDAVDHALHSHDDIANAVAGAIYAAMQDERRLGPAYAPGYTPAKIFDADGGK